MKPNAKIVIRESQSKPQLADADFDLVIYWSSFVDTGQSTKYLSLPALVETNAELIRDQILDFIDSIRIFEVNGQSIEDSLKISGSFSYWWLTLPALKRWQESSRLFDLARLFALELALAGQGISEVAIEVEDVDVQNCIQHFVNYQGATFRNVAVAKPNQSRKARNRSLPWNRFRALVLALKFLINGIFRGLSSKSRTPIDTSVKHVFFDYFDLGAKNQRTHHSRFWGPLQNELRRHDIKTQWIHVIPELRSSRQIKRANQQCDEFSRNMASEIHAPLDTMPTISRWFRILKIYAHVAKANQKILHACGQPIKGHPSLCFLPLLRPQIIDSLIGATAIHHCNLVVSFEELLQTLKDAKFIVYPMENQPWEKTLLGLYKDKTEANIIGAPHSVVKFWDLRFFEPQNSNIEFRNFQFPNTVAVNSSHTRTMVETNKYPSCEVVDVEALRYLGLINHIHSHDTAKTSGKVTILVLGDFLSRANRYLISIADRGLKRSLPTAQIIYRPHPLQGSNDRMVPDGWTLTSTPLLTILDDVDIVIMTSSGSAVIEARSFGKQVILIIDPNVFDYSILRNDAGIVRVTNDDELSEALTQAIFEQPQPLDNFFTLDSELPRWKYLLEMDTVAIE